MYKNIRRPINDRLSINSLLGLCAESNETVVTCVAGCRDGALQN